jgi:hypothetical protein
LLPKSKKPLPENQQKLKRLGRPVCTPSLFYWNLSGAEFIWGSVLKNAEPQFHSTKEIYSDFSSKAATGF